VVPDGGGKDYDLAQINLGNLSNLAEVSPKDYVLAYMWYNLAVIGTPGEEERELRAMGRDRIASR